MENKKPWHWYLQPCYGGVKGWIVTGDDIKITPLINQKTAMRYIKHHNDAIQVAESFFQRQSNSHHIENEMRSALVDIGVALLSERNAHAIVDTLSFDDFETVIERIMRGLGIDDIEDATPEGFVKEFEKRRSA